MTILYKPLYIKLFKKFGYSWEDIDLFIYSKILKEEGFTKPQIEKEIKWINEHIFF